MLADLVLLDLRYDFEGGGAEAARCTMLDLVLVHFDPT